MKSGTPSLGDPAVTIVRHLSDDFTKTRGFIAEDAGGASIIAVKGTASLADALEDACVMQSSFLGKYPVHTGFREEFDRIWPAVQAYVTANPTRPLFVTGHSLGGAIATLVALALKKELGRDVSLVTFGSPRVGDKTFVREFDRAPYREASVTWREAAGRALPGGVRQAIASLVGRYLERLGKEVRPEALLRDSVDDETFVNFFAQHLDVAPLEKQALLEAPTLVERARGLADVLEFRLEELRLPLGGTPHRPH